MKFYVFLFLKEEQPTQPENNIAVMDFSNRKFNSYHKTETFVMYGSQVPFLLDRISNRGGGLAVYVKQGINYI